MKESVFVKKIDDLGRVVVPKDIRKALGINNGEEVRFEVIDDTVIIRKAVSTCVFCGSEDKLTEIKDKHVCKNCIEQLSNG